MDTALTGLIVTTIILLAILTLSYTFLSAQETILGSWQEAEERISARSHTYVTSVGAQSLSNGAVVEITLRNEGQVKLADFDRWDVILQYQAADTSNHIEWYSPGTGQNEWEVYDIYLETPTIPEVFEPGILNPGEEIVIWVSVSPAVGTGTTNLATVATDCGVSATTVFTR